MRILVLGGYGLIGLGIAKRLLRDGHEVVGLGRSAARGRALLPEAVWIALDLAHTTQAEQWTPHLRKIDAVVNCSGALQDGPGGRLGLVHRDAVIALIEACERLGVSTFIQISVPGASPDAETAFLSTKGEADARLMRSTLRWTVFRPGLVLAPTAFGGTSLLRLLAGFPLVLPLVMARAPMATVVLDDVAEAVTLAIDGSYAGHAFDLMEARAPDLEELAAAMRAWLGFAPARLTFRLPKAFGYAVAKGADLAGRLGWRSALRTTSLRMLERGVRGDPGPWEQASGRTLSTYRETLAHLPSTLQERLYARAALAFPVMLLTLAGFWIVSGGVGLWSLGEASRHLAGSLSPAQARLAVIGASFLDFGIGTALLVRFTARLACLAAVLLSTVYLAVGSLTVPELWLDPFGPMVKVLPGMALALGVAALMEER